MRGTDGVHATTYPFLEQCALVRCECVGLGYHWDDVDLHAHHGPTRKDSECYTPREKANLFMELLHKCYVNLPQPVYINHTRLAQRIRVVQGAYPCPVGAMKYRQQWMRLSSITSRTTRDSSFKYSSYFASMCWMMGDQLHAHTIKRSCCIPCCIPWSACGQPIHYTSQLNM